jgi:hypothetical protein
MMTWMRTPEREGGDERGRQASKQAINQSNRIEAIYDESFCFLVSVPRFMYGMTNEGDCFIPWWLWMDGWVGERVTLMTGQGAVV